MTLNGEKHKKSVRISASADFLVFFDAKTFVKYKSII